MIWASGRATRQSPSQLRVSARRRVSLTRMTLITTTTSAGNVAERASFMAAPGIGSAILGMGIHASAPAAATYAIRPNRESSLNSKGCANFLLMPLRKRVKPGRARDATARVSCIDKIAALMATRFHAHNAPRKGWKPLVKTRRGLMRSTTARSARMRPETIHEPLSLKPARPLGSSPPHSGPVRTPASLWAYQGNGAAAQGMAGKDIGAMSDYCEACHGPICGYSRAELVWQHFCWLVIVKLVPVRLMMWQPFKWMLPYCGNHAYACSCPDKNLAARTTLRADQ